MEGLNQIETTLERLAQVVEAGFDPKKTALEPPFDPHKTAVEPDFAPQEMRPAIDRPTLVKIFLPFYHQIDQAAFKLGKFEELVRGNKVTFDDLAKAREVVRAIARSATKVAKALDG